MALVNLVMSLDTPDPGHPKVGAKTVRAYFDTLRADPNFTSSRDISDRQELDWVSWIFTAWPQDRARILEAPITQAVVRYNPRVRDPNAHEHHRRGLMRLELLLHRADGQQVRLYPGAKLIIEPRELAQAEQHSFEARSHIMQEVEHNTAPSVDLLGVRAVLAFWQRLDAMLSPCARRAMSRWDPDPQSSHSCRIAGCQSCGWGFPDPAMDPWKCLVCQGAFCSQCLPGPHLLCPTCFAGNARTCPPFMDWYGPDLAEHENLFVGIRGGRTFDFARWMASWPPVDKDLLMQKLGGDAGRATGYRAVAAFKLGTVNAQAFETGACITGWCFLVRGETERVVHIAISSKGKKRMQLVQLEAACEQPNCDWTVP